MVTRSEILTIAQSSVSLLDPHVWTDAPDQLNIRSAVYEPLVRPDGRGGHACVLAESWKSTDARSWTFTVREGVRFHNGKPLCAADVVAALDRARNPMMAGELGTTGLYCAYLGGAKLDLVDADRVRIVTERPTADILDVLAEIPIVSRNQGRGAEHEFCGTGPYRVVDHGPSWLRMASAKPYWAGAPPFERVMWRAMGDEQARVAALMAEEADVATELLPSALARLGPEGPITVQEVATSGCVVFMCNSAAGACVDSRVRRALNHGLDVPAIIKRVRQGAATPLNGPLTPLSLGHDPSVPPFHHDPDMARALLRAAGHQDGLELILQVPTTTPGEAPALAKMVTTQYANIGIAVDVRVCEDRSAYSEMVRAKRIGDLACFDSTPASTYRVFREKFHSGVAGPWWQGYANEQVDRLIDEGASLPDPRERANRYREAYRLIRDDAAWVFLYSPTTLVGVGRAAGPVSIERQGMIRFDVGRN